MSPADKHAGAFHATLQVAISDARAPIFSDLRPISGGAEGVWNHAVYKYVSWYEDVGDMQANRHFHITTRFFANVDQPPLGDANTKTRGTDQGNPDTHDARVQEASYVVNFDGSGEHL